MCIAPTTSSSPAMPMKFLPGNSSAGPRTLIRLFNEVKIARAVSHPNVSACVRPRRRGIAALHLDGIRRR